MGRTADSLVEAVFLDMWPSMPACVDFGLDGYGGGDPQRRYNALHYAIRAGNVTADELHHCVVNGGLTNLIRANNPDQEVEFVTMNDMIRSPFGDYDDEDEE